MKSPATLILLTVLLSSCAGRAIRDGNVRIILPQPPKRIAVVEQGVPKDPGTEYIDAPVKVGPGEEPLIPPTGGALLSPRSWRAVRYALTEWPRWAAAVKSMVAAHNEAVARKPPWEPWWSTWWR